MPKINLPEHIKELKSQLETGRNLVDYFLVAGINPINCENGIIYDIKNKDYIKNFKEQIKPNIISRFPSFDNAIDTIDEEIVNYCFPDGFEPILTNEKNLDKKFYSVILDNNLFSAEHPQKYLTCLIFYEKVSDYKKLKLSIEGLSYEKDPECMEDEEDDKDMIKNRTGIQQNVDIMNSTAIEKNYPLTKSLQFNDLNDKKSMIALGRNPSFLSSEVTSIKNVFIPKCISLVSIYPFIKFHQKLLEIIYDYIKKNREIPIEKILISLIIEVPVPPRGLYSIIYNFIDNKFVLENNENNKIQLAEISMKKFNNMIPFKDKLEALKHILLGSKLLIFSRDLNKISECELALLHLLFPFKYPFQVTSFLHKDNYSILESISPFIIGINEPYTPSFFENNEITVDGMTIFIIDLDKKRTELITDEEFPNFPAKIVSNLEKEIKVLEQKSKSHTLYNINQVNVSPIKDFNSKYQNLFLFFFSELLKGYEDYLNMDYFKQTDSDKVTSIETLFRCEKFVKSHSSDMDFYSKFVDDSQLFADFIYKRMIPRNTQEIIDVLLINETITKIRNKSKLIGKGHTDFLDSNEYKAKNKYVVPGPKELTEEEIKILIQRKQELKSQGQILTSNAENNKLLIKYLLFPELNFDVFCNNENVNDYCLPPDYSEEMEALNIELISHSSIGQSINNALEMKNYLYLTWLEIWAFTFWYIDKDERPYRFNQMLDIIDKVIHHEMNIFNLMFDVLNQQNEHEMILNLYQKLLKKNINPSTFIYNIISNILDKEQIKELFDIAKQEGAERCLKLKVETINFNERTFLNNYDKSLISSKLKFENSFTCIKCQNPINLYVLCQKFDNIKKDILWVPCECGEYNLPKINVRFGLELFPSRKVNKKDSTKTSTSITNEIVLHSPYNLKMNINNAVMTHYSGKINIHNFKTKFSALFWNFIWYCHLNHLDYTIILPYLKNLEKSKEKAYNNPNNEILQITFNNKLYRNNIVKMYEPTSKRADKETMKKMLKKAYKDLVEKKMFSFEIQKVTKDKNKKLVSQYIDHLNINANKANAINSLMKTKTILEGHKGTDKKLFNNKKVGATINPNAHPIKSPHTIKNPNTIKNPKDTTKNKKTNEKSNTTTNTTTNTISNQNKINGRKTTNKKK